MVNRKAIMGGLGLFAVIVFAIALAPLITRQIRKVAPI